MGKKIEIGQFAEYSKKIDEVDVKKFAELTGDINLIHLDDESAKRSVFGRRVIHGMYVAGLISTVLGTKLPGNGTIYLEQIVRFKRPAYINDILTARVTLTSVLNEEKGIFNFDTIVYNQFGDNVIEGYAIVLNNSDG